MKTRSLDLLLSRKTLQRIMMKEHIPTMLRTLRVKECPLSWR